MTWSSSPCRTGPAWPTPGRRERRERRANQSSTKPPARSPSGPAIGGSEALVQVVRNLDAAHIEPSGLALRRPSLDDVFLAITGHAAEEEEPAAGRPSSRGGSRAPDRTVSHRRRTEP